jgi:hypothetical protein
VAYRKKGLRVKYCENLGTYIANGNGSFRINETTPDGWYVMVSVCSQWRAMMNLRFLREKDDLRAAQALTVAGLDTHDKLREADPLTVKHIACEHLQW